MAKRDSRGETLLAALQRIPQGITAFPGGGPPSATAPPAPAPPARGGKAVQFWLHDEDRKVIRELAAYLSSQGVRPTDSLIVRAALRLVQGDASLVNAFKEALAHDGRYRPRARRPTTL